MLLCADYLLLCLLSSVTSLEKLNNFFFFLFKIHWKSFFNLFLDSSFYIQEWWFLEFQSETNNKFQFFILHVCGNLVSHNESADKYLQRDDCILVTRTHARPIREGNV